MPSVRDALRNRTSGMARRFVGWLIVLGVLAIIYLIYLALR
jgi:hypothetical protein